MSAQLAIAMAHAEAMKVLAAEQAELNFVHDELKNMRVKLAELDAKKTSRRRGGGSLNIEHVRHVMSGMRGARYNGPC